MKVSADKVGAADLVGARDAAARHSPPKNPQNYYYFRAEDI